MDSRIQLINIARFVTTACGERSQMTFLMNIHFHDIAMVKYFGNIVLDKRPARGGVMTWLNTKE